MSETSEKVEGLKAKVEEKRRELETAVGGLKTHIEAKNEEIDQMGKALEEAQWEERLEKVERELGSFYRQEGEVEDEVNREINKLFNKVSKTVEKINLRFKDLKELKKKISNLDKELIQNSGDDNSQMRQAVEFKRAEVIREVEVTPQIKGSSSLVKVVNNAMGMEPGGALVGSEFNVLPRYAQNIYDEMRLSRGKPVKARVDEWIRVARIPEPRIIRAREELDQSLEVLRKKGLIDCEEEGDVLTVRESLVEEGG